MEISKQEYDSIIHLMRCKKLSVLIDTAGFRHLFSQINGHNLSEKVGFSVVTHVATIKSLPLVEFACLIASNVFLGLATRWLAILWIPLLCAFWIFFKGRTSYGRQRILPASTVLIISLIFALAATKYDIWLRVFVLSAGCLQFATRFMYYFTARVVFGLIERSYRFFSMFYLEPKGAIIPLIWTDPPQHESNSE